MNRSNENQYTELKVRVNRVRFVDENNTATPSKYELEVGSKLLIFRNNPNPNCFDVGTPAICTEPVDLLTLVNSGSLLISVPSQYSSLFDNPISSNKEGLETVFPDDIYETIAEMLIVQPTMADHIVADVIISQVLPKSSLSDIAPVNNMTSVCTDKPFSLRPKIGR
jgi:hypothetical protein